MGLSALLGAAHGLEIPFVFNNFDSGFLGSYMSSDENLSGRRALAVAMSSYWAEFAYTGSPGRGRGQNQTEWRPWDNSLGAENKFIILDTPSDGGIRMSSNTVGLGELRERLRAEAGFRSQEEHCETYAIALAGSELWNDDEYARLGREGCGDYPKETYMR